MPDFVTRLRRSSGGALPPLPSYVQTIEDNANLIYLIDYRSFYNNNTLVETVETPIDMLKDARGKAIQASSTISSAKLSLNNYNRRVLNLNGTGFFTLGTDPTFNLNPTTGFSIFVRIASYDTDNNGTIIGKGGTDYAQRNHLMVVKNNGIYFQVGGKDVNEIAAIKDYKTTDAPPTNFHLKASSSLLEYRRDNVIIDSVASPTYYESDVETRLFAQGNGSATSNFRYKGLIEKLLIFKGNLTEAEITNINNYMNLGRVGSYVPPQTAPAV